LNELFFDGYIPTFSKAIMKLISNKNQLLLELWLLKSINTLTNVLSLKGCISGFLQKCKRTRHCSVVGSVQSFKTRPGPRPGFRVLAGSPGLTGSAGSILFLKKNQNDVVLVKKKNKKKQKSTGLSPGLDRVLPGQPGHTGFFLPPFFHQPGPVPAPGRPGPGLTRRAGFQNYVYLGMHTAKSSMFGI
jgi:hypothetical protein